jgi:hypothetical protein
VRVGLATRKPDAKVLCKQVIQSYGFNQESSVLVTKENRLACQGLVFNGVLTKHRSAF